MSGSITGDGELEASLPSSTTADPIIETDANNAAGMFLLSHHYTGPESRIKVIWRRFLDRIALVVSGVAISKNLPGGATVFNAFALVWGILRALMYVYQLLLSLLILTNLTLQYRKRLETCFYIIVGAGEYFCEYILQSLSKFQAVTD